MNYYIFLAIGIIFILLSVRRVKEQDLYIKGKAIMGLVIGVLIILISMFEIAVSLF
jgi:hypothetical protein